MKSISRGLLLALSLATLITGCQNATSSSSNAQVTTLDSLPAAPASLAADDNAVTGVYKGVVADKNLTGSFWINVVADGTKTAGVSATLNVFLDATKLVIVTGSATKATDYTLTFPWSYSGTSYALTLVVSAAGVISATTAPALTAGATPIGIAVAKQLSTSAVETWQGTATGTSSQSGTGWTATTATSVTWNFIVQGTNLTGTYQGLSTTTVSPAPPSQPTPTPFGASFTGTISGSSITFPANGGTPDTTTGTFAGRSIGSTVSGTWAWTDTTKGSGTWTGKRIQ